MENKKWVKNILVLFLCCALPQIFYAQAIANPQMEVIGGQLVDWNICTGTFKDFDDHVDLKNSPLIGQKMKLGDRQDKIQLAFRFRSLGTPLGNFEVWLGDASCILVKKVYSAPIQGGWNVPFVTFSNEAPVQGNFDYIFLRFGSSVHFYPIKEGFPLINNSAIRYDDLSCGNGANLNITKVMQGNTWNAEQAINLNTAFNVSDPSRISWFVQDKISLEYRYISNPSNFYFCAEGPNRDEWGKVRLRPVYNCNGATRYYDTPFFDIEVVDAGVYFRNAAGDLQRWHVDKWNSNAQLYNGFYNPNKPTIVLAHGWQPNKGNLHENGITPEKRDVRPRLIEGGGEDVAKYWIDKGWNVAVFYWSQYAEQANLSAFPETVAKRIINNGPQWRKTDGNYTGASSTTDPIGVYFAKRMKQIKYYTGSTKEVRWTGHSLGSILITKAAQWLIQQGESQYLPSRLVYLDPAWSEGMFNMWRYDLLLSNNIDNYPAIEWYQTSPYNIKFTILNGYSFTNPFGFEKSLLEGITPAALDLYNKATRKTTYVRLHPKWEASYPIGAQLGHASARRYYYASLRDTERIPVVVFRVPVNFTGPIVTDIEHQLLNVSSDRYQSNYIINGVTFTGKFHAATASGSGPSAKATLADLKKWRGTPLSQVGGLNTLTTNDDFFAIQRFKDEFPARTYNLGDKITMERCTDIELVNGFFAAAGSSVTINTGVDCTPALCTGCANSLTIYNDDIDYFNEQYAPQVKNVNRPDILDLENLPASCNHDHHEETNPFTQALAKVHFDFKVAPNPTTGTAILQTEKITIHNASLRVFDPVGKEIINRPLPILHEAPLREEINLDNQSPGVYFLVIQGETGTIYSNKIIKR